MIERRLEFKMRFQENVRSWFGKKRERERGIDRKKGRKKEAKWRKVRGWN